MKAMVLYKITSLEATKRPLELVELPIPEPDTDGLLIKVSVCGVCHTELDEIEGRTPPTEFPRVLGHQVVGTVVKVGAGVLKFKEGERVRVAWIFSACGKCSFCLEGYENLCDHFLATGRDVNGGYAEYMVAKERFTYHIPDLFSDAEAAPLLCAGAIGYRSLRLARLGDGQKLGLSGFGASGHLMLKMADHLYPGTQVYVFARNGEERSFAKDLGAYWIGNHNDLCPVKLSCIIDTTPAWKPVVQALGNLEKNGRLIINAIRKEEGDRDYLQNISYRDHLWLEKEIKTVANVTAMDVTDFLRLAADIGIRPKVEVFPLVEANTALVALKEKRVKGSKVLRIS